MKAMAPLSAVPSEEDVAFTAKEEHEDDADEDGAHPLEMPGAEPLSSSMETVASDTTDTKEIQPASPTESEESADTASPSRHQSILSTIPQSLFAIHMAPLVKSRELARFCLASRDASRLEPLLARLVAETQHGVFQDRVFTLVELCHTLDCMRDRASFEFTRPFMAAILKPERREGDHRMADFMLVDVGGGQTGYRTVAACPPVRGDCWKLLLPLRRGRYQLIVSGWRNPHHGILDITLDNKAVSPEEGLDWYSETATNSHTFRNMLLEVTTTGTHILRGETKRCNSSALGAKYWICLESLRILPIGEVEKDAMPPVPPRRRPHSVQRSRLAPLLAASTAALWLASVVGAAGFVASYWLKIVLRPIHGLLSHLGVLRRWPFQR